MKPWIVLAGLLLVACAAAFGWHLLANDPGYVLIRLGSTRIETTVVFAVVAVLLTWGLISLAWRLLHWPSSAWRRRSQRRGHERIAGGLTALIEGHYARAQRDLERASHQTGLRAPALLAAAQAAHALGEPGDAEAALNEAATHSPGAALTMRARFLLRDAKPKAALALLNAEAIGAPLPPEALRIQTEAALACGEYGDALRAVKSLLRSDSAKSPVVADLQTRVVAAALNAATDSAQLDALWAGLSRAQRNLTALLGAYAARAAVFGQTLAAMDVLESALRRHWSERLVETYGALGEAEAQSRLRRAEGWLQAHSDSSALLLTLGRLCIQCELWGKAAEYLQRGLQLAPSAKLWEAMGDCRNGQNAPADAAICYRNALRSGRDQPTQALTSVLRGPPDTRASAIEERSEHGIPRLSPTSRSN